MFHYADPPLLLEDLIEDPLAVENIFAAGAPYTPLGGWYRPDNEGEEARSPMWFQGDWVHDGLHVDGSDLFLHHERVMQASRDFYDAKIVVPHSIYVNLMVAMQECGPAHTDNPFFAGRNRTNTPMFLLRTMLWSGLFENWVIPQSTSIWWLNDVEGGGLAYWGEGPSRPPQRHVGAMANTALVGDNHGMFHQVEAVGPFDRGTILVPASAELAPDAEGSGDWTVRHGGRELYRAPFSGYRASVLWKADVFRDEEEQQRLAEDLLTMEDVARIFNEDLARRGESLRLELDTLEQSGTISALAAIYPEDVPVGKGPSIFDAA